MALGVPVKVIVVPVLGQIAAVPAIFTMGAALMVKVARLVSFTQGATPIIV